MGRHGAGEGAESSTSWSVGSRKQIGLNFWNLKAHLQSDIILPRTHLLIVPFPMDQIFRHMSLCGHSYSNQHSWCLILWDSSVVFTHSGNLLRLALWYSIRLGLFCTHLKKMFILRLGKAVWHFRDCVVQKLSILKVCLSICLSWHISEETC